MVLVGTCADEEQGLTWSCEDRPGFCELSSVPRSALELRFLKSALDSGRTAFRVSGRSKEQSPATQAVTPNMVAGADGFSAPC